MMQSMVPNLVVTSKRRKKAALPGKCNERKSLRLTYFQKCPVLLHIGHFAYFFTYNGFGVVVLIYNTVLVFKTLSLRPLNAGEDMRKYLDG